MMLHDVITPGKSVITFPGNVPHRGKITRYFIGWTRDSLYQLVQYRRKGVVLPDDISPGRELIWLT
ncbi:hypothetical protein SAMN04488515_2031 [Cognatiyoonia koreensis]|uniref:Uncharacterized protein n=1 Tax=Cognatiyoonia koreensis TaxID=364200 RepID=A0A1I0QMM8_9RHOB|nr:hypothetical protein SAMN04488515_2031 [Cognatiyoonia koreensis]